MSAQWALAVSQIGLSLFDSLLQASAQEDIAEARAELAEIRNQTVQQQLDERAQYFTRQRREYLTQTLGRQEVALAAANVVGGRTARLIQAQTRLEVSRAAERRRVEIAQKRFESQLNAQTAGRAGQVAAGIAVQESLFDAIVSGVNTYVDLSQQSEAIQGISSGSGSRLEMEGSLGLEL